MNLSAIAIRHVAYEDLGIVESVLIEHGYSVRYRDAGVQPLDRDEILSADLVIVLGGPIGIGDMARYPVLVEERDVIRRRIDAGGPIVGICLGAQLLAAAYDAAVVSTGSVEIGYAPVTLTSAGTDSVLAELGSVPVLHWHGDQFDIPDGAQRLAHTPGFPNQAFSVGRHILGLQFHIEADPARIEQWLIGHAHELAAHDIDPRMIRRDAQTVGPELSRRARSLFSAWLLGLPGR